MIQLDYSRDSLLTEQARSLMEDYYMLPTETSPQEAFARPALAFCKGDLAFAQRIYDYTSRQFAMYASPVLSNAPIVDGLFNPVGKIKGMPISCFLNYVPDTISGIIDTGSETRWLSVMGGGVGGYWGSVRAPDKKSPGVIPFVADINSAMNAYKQGETRKGAYAAYLDVSHPSIREFIQIRVPTGGDVNRKCFTLHNAVNLADEFMEAVEARGKFLLRNPVTQEVTEEVDAFELFCDILEVRFRTGEPYLNFIDTVNRALPTAQKMRGLKVHASNLCNEIHLPTDEERTAVCCLSSLNLEKFEEWKDTTIVEDFIRFLDNVLDFFIENAPDQLSKAVYSASKERAVGLGAMGWHGYLQRKGIPFESAIAVGATHRIFSTIKSKALEETARLAEERGEPDDLKGTGVRNSHLLAIAPNANSSILCNCSASIEPLRDNAYPHRTRAGTHLIKNKFLEQELSKLGLNTEDVWNQIVRADGSVAGIKGVPDNVKEVFKTFGELDMHWVVTQAGARQQYLCQGQSVNLYFNPGATRQYVRSVHELAWREGLKGLYYLRTSSGESTDKVGTDVLRNALVDSNLIGEDCVACQG